MALATREPLIESNLGALSNPLGKAPHARGKDAGARDGALPAVRASSIWERGIVAVLLAAIVATALASGAVETWSVAIFELMVVLVILLWAGKFYSDRRLSIVIPPAAPPICLLVLIGLAQSVALGGKDGKTLSLSLDVEATRSAVLAVFLLLACFLAGANFFIGRKRIRMIARCFVIYGLVMAIFALIQHLASDGHTYWLRPLSQGTSWFGPFVNHSHFAGYMALLIPLPVALMMNKSVRSEERLWFGFAAAAMGLSVVVSLSRGGLIALASELLFLVIAGSRPRGRLIARRDARSTGQVSGPGAGSLAALGVIIVSIGAGVLWLAPDPVANRFVRGNATASPQGESFYESRGWIWRDSMRVFEAHPLFGAGMGAFETAFPIYSKSDGSLLVSQAHNDYLQVLTDCGILGGILAIWFIAAIAVAISKGLRSLDHFTRSLSLGCGAAILGMLVHCVFDFNLQLPSTALLFLLTCAIASVAGDTPAHRRAQAGAALATLLVFAGCLLDVQAGVEPSRTAGVNSRTAGVNRNLEKQDADRSAGAAGSARQSGSQGGRTDSIPSGGDYVLEPTDVIEVHIEDAPELSKKFTISSDGTIPMEYLKTITVGGKTCQQVERTIADGLRARYLKDPHVTVTVLQSNSRSYYIQGAVRVPGVYVVAGHPTLMKLLTIAGGLADNHGSTAFIIREIKDQRIGSTNGPDATAQSKPDPSQATNAPADDRPKYDLMKTNINGLFRGDFRQDMPVQPGDIINIPQTDLFFVAGEVRKPGSFPLKDGTTLQQAISMAEGTTFKAATGDALIFRDDARGKRTEIKVDVGAVMRGKREDVPILANDIIVVPNSRTRSALQIVLQGFGASAMRLPIP